MNVASVVERAVYGLDSVTTMPQRRVGLRYPEGHPRRRDLRVARLAPDGRDVELAREGEALVGIGDPRPVRVLGGRAEHDGDVGERDAVGGEREQALLDEQVAHVLVEHGLPVGDRRPPPPRSPTLVWMICSMTAAVA